MWTMDCCCAVVYFCEISVLKNKNALVEPCYRNTSFKASASVYKLYNCCVEDLVHNI